MDANGRGRPAAVLFDMDGLLLDTERLAQESFLEVSEGFAAGTGRAERAQFFLTLIGAAGYVTRARVAERFPGVDVEAAAAAWRAAFERRVEAGVPLRPHVRESLAVLAEAGVRMAVVTSTEGDRARHHLRTADLLHRFERVTGGDEVSATKPDPAPYRETAAALGVDPSDCWAFEDSDTGTRSAVAAGCRVIQIPDLRPPGTEPPDLGQMLARDLREALTRLGVGALR